MFCDFSFGNNQQSAVESSEEVIAQDVPTFLDPMRLYTLRYRYQASPRYKKDNPAKVRVCHIQPHITCALQEAAFAHQSFLFLYPCH